MAPDFVGQGVRVTDFINSIIKSSLLFVLEYEKSEIKMFYKSFRTKADDFRKKKRLN